MSYTTNGLGALVVKSQSQLTAERAAAAAATASQASANTGSYLIYGALALVGLGALGIVLTRKKRLGAQQAVANRRRRRRRSRRRARRNCSR